MEKTTQVQHYKQKEQRLKSRLCVLLGWDDLQYGMFQFETGLKFLSIYLNKDDFFINQIVRNKLFWAWWRNHWVLRDEAFLLENEIELNRIHRENILKIYKHTHDPEILTTEIHPSGTMLGITYKAMIGEVIKEEVAA